MGHSNYVCGTIWITGICASGKTTLGKRLHENLIARGIENVEFFDGEELRKKLSRTYGYSSDDRLAAINEMTKIVCESNKNGKVAIISVLSHKRQARKIARQNINNFMEVYLNCPVNVCAKRDYKGHYKKAFAGELDNFIGVTEPYEISKSPELIINTASSSIGECSKILLDQALRFLKLMIIILLGSKLVERILKKKRVFLNRSPWHSKKMKFV